jgi:hypothetical protein
VGEYNNATCQHFQFELCDKRREVMVNAQLVWTEQQRWYINCIQQPPGGCTAAQRAAGAETQETHTAGNNIAPTQGAELRVCNSMSACLIRASR